MLRGWTVVLELSVDTSDSSNLTLNPIGPDGRPYKKHFLDLKGLGVSELCAHGEDLLVLAGPTMNLDGPTLIYRWKGGINSQREDLVRGRPISAGTGNSIWVGGGSCRGHDDCLR